MVKDKNRFFRFVVLCNCLLLFLIFPCFTQNNSSAIYPEIKKLTFSDPVFKQFLQDVNDNYITLASDNDYILTFYSYTVKKDDDLLSIAARCNIPYEAISTINRISFIDSLVAGMKIYLPTVKGIFLAKNAREPLEFLLKTRYATSEYISFFINNVEFGFIPNERLSGTERLFFTDSTMVTPIDEGVISSNFGMRESPFSGDPSFHSGVDIAAPLGTKVFASKGGLVAIAQYGHPVYGNYVILQHDNNTHSLYAHLNTLEVSSGDICVKRQVLGTVGTTGMSTGPHLHFEIRIGMKVENPAQIINNFMQ